MSTLAELRAKVNKAQEQSRTNNFDSNSIFSFKNLKAGDKIRIRFVPDGEPNDFFWRPLNTRSLQFNSIRLNTGEIVQNRTYVSVPAFNIQKNEVNLNGLPDEHLYYSNDDVIQQKIKGFWNGTDEGRKLYGKFGKNQRYVFQGFVRAEGYETKLYRFIINKELFGTSSACSGSHATLLDGFANTVLHRRWKSGISQSHTCLPSHLPSLLTELFPSLLHFHPRASG